MLGFADWSPPSALFLCTSGILETRALIQSVNARSSNAKEDHTPAVRFICARLLFPISFARLPFADFPLLAFHVFIPSSWFFFSDGGVGEFPGVRCVYVAFSNSPRPQRCNSWQAMQDREWSVPSVCLGCSLDKRGGSRVLHFHQWYHRLSVFSSLLLLLSLSLILQVAKLWRWSTRYKQHLSVRIITSIIIPQRVKRGKQILLSLCCCFFTLQVDVSAAWFLSHHTLGFTSHCTLLKWHISSSMIFF